VNCYAFVRSESSEQDRGLAVRRWECGIAAEFTGRGRCGENPCELPAQGTALSILGTLVANSGASLGLSPDPKKVCRYAPEVALNVQALGPLLRIEIFARQQADKVYRWSCALRLLRGSSVLDSTINVLLVHATLNSFQLRDGSWQMLWMLRCLNQYETWVSTSRSGPKASARPESRLDGTCHRGKANRSSGSRNRVDTNHLKSNPRRDRILSVLHPYGR